MTAKKNRSADLFILGAGASVDYGLPTWDGLKDQMLSDLPYIQPKDLWGANSAAPEGIAWSNPLNAAKRIVQEVHPDKKYQTIDEAIVSEIEEIGDVREAELLEKILILAIARQLKYDLRTGWIGDLLWKSPAAVQDAFFISFNYDNVLLCEIEDYVRSLTFEKRNESLRLPGQWRKRRSLRNKIPDAKAESEKMLAALDEQDQAMRDGFRPRMFFPHGLMYAKDWIAKGLVDTRHCRTRVDDAREDGVEAFKAPSLIGNIALCYDPSAEESPFQAIKEANIKAKCLYVAGLGSGLETNLDKIDFNGMDIREVIFTCHDENNLDKCGQYFKRKLGSAKQICVKACNELLSLYLDRQKAKIRA